METLNTLNSQRNFEQKEQCWNYHYAWLQIILHKHDDWGSMVMKQNQVCGPNE